MRTRFKDSDLAVWWLSEKDYHGYEPHCGPNPLKVADYIWEQFCYRYGRPGRLRLWVPKHIDLDELPVRENDPRWDMLRGWDYGGIVIERKDAEPCKLWSGVVTDLELRKL